MTQHERVLPQPQLVCYTKQYGLTYSYSQPNFYEGTQQLVGYQLHVPQPVDEVAHIIAGLGGQAMLVGGCVRDTVIAATHSSHAHLLPKDYDFEVYGLSPNLLEQILEDHFGPHNIDHTGKAFGIIKAKHPDYDQPFDFSIPRTDSKVGDGHRDFVTTSDPSMSVKDAALRRDLTMNTMFYDPLTGSLYDSYHAVDDIQNRLIRVTDHEKFQEDPLRVLRVMQFAARFGFEIDPQTTYLCRQMVEEGQLDHLPVERITEEFRKLLEKGQKPSIGLDFARQIGIVSRYWPELNNLIDCPQTPSWHPEGDVWNHTLQVVDAMAIIAHQQKKLGAISSDDLFVLMASGLCHDLGKPATTKRENNLIKSHGHEAAGIDISTHFLSRFSISKSEIIKISGLVSQHMAPKEFWLVKEKTGNPMNKAVNHLADRLGSFNTTTYLLSLLAEADQRGRNGNDSLPLERSQVDDLDSWQNWFLEIVDQYQIREKPQPKLVNGDQVMNKLGINYGGCWLGVVLRATYCDQLDGLVTTTDAALDQAEKHYLQLTSFVDNRSIDQNKLPSLVWAQLRQLDDPRLEK